MFRFRIFFLEGGGGGGRGLMGMAHGVPEIEMNDDYFHAKSTVANLEP